MLIVTARATAAASSPRHQRVLVGLLYLRRHDILVLLAAGSASPPAPPTTTRQPSSPCSPTAHLACWAPLREANPDYVLLSGARAGVRVATAPGGARATGSCGSAAARMSHPRRPPLRGADPWVTTPPRRPPVRELAPTQLTQAPATRQAPAGRGVARLKSWRIFRKSPVQTETYRGRSHSGAAALKELTDRAPGTHDGASSPDRSSRTR